MPIKGASKNVYHKMYPDIKEDDLVTEVKEIVVQKIGHIPVAKGDFSKLPRAVKIFVSHCVSIRHDMHV